MTENKTKTDNRKVIFSIIAIAIAIILVAAGIIAVVKYGKGKKNDSSNDSPVAVNESEADVSSEIKAKTVSPDYITYLAKDSIIKIEEYDYNGIVALTNSATVYIGANNNPKSNKLEYKNPVMIVDGKNVLIYDKEGKKYRTETSAGIINEFEAKGNILAAAYSNGEILIATRGSSAASAFEAFDKDHLPGDTKNKKSGTIANEFITDVKYTKNEKGFVTASVGCSNAEIYTIYRAYEFGHQSYMYKLPCDRETNIYMKPGAAEDLTYITDAAFRKSHYTISTSENNTTDEIQSFSSDTVCAVLPDKNDKYLTIAVNELGSTDSIVLYFYSSSGEAYNSVRLSRPYVSINGGSKYVAVDYGNEIEIYSRKGEQTGRILLQTANSLCIPSDSNVYVLADNRFYCLDATGNYELKEKSTGKKDKSTELFTINVTESNTEEETTKGDNS